MKHLKARYRAEDVNWVRPGNRGKPKPWALSEALRQQILALAQDKCAGFNDSHLTEKLAEVEQLEVSRERVRRLLRGAGVASPQKRRPPGIVPGRERRPRFGMMVLADASREDWREGRGPLLSWIGYQDDATSQVLAARFPLEHEGTVGYPWQPAGAGGTLRGVLEPVSGPARHVSRHDKNWTLAEQLAGCQSPTPFGARD